jgi:hypothetical protein
MVELTDESDPLEAQAGYYAVKTTSLILIWLSAKSEVWPVSAFKHF